MERKEEDTLFQYFPLSIVTSVSRISNVRRMARIFARKNRTSKERSTPASAIRVYRNEITYLPAKPKQKHAHARGTRHVHTCTQ